jgi:hypothetical protein
MCQSVPLPAGWGQAHIRAPGQHAECGSRTARSYDHLGNQLVWSPPAALLPTHQFACDLETSARDSHAQAALFRLPSGEFLRRWVVAEVLAKLSDTPILLWVKRYGLPHLAKNPAGRFDWHDCGLTAQGLVLAHAVRPPAVLAFGLACLASPHDADQPRQSPAVSKICAPTLGGAVVGTVVWGETTLC